MNFTNFAQLFVTNDEIHYDITKKMKNQMNFIKQCEKDLILDRNLSDFTLTLVHKLSDKNKILCEPILNFIGRMKSPIDIKVNTKEFEFLSKSGGTRKIKKFKKSRRTRKFVKNKYIQRNDK